MELKFIYNYSKLTGSDPFNRTAYGIEMRAESPVYMGGMSF